MLEHGGRLRRAAETYRIPVSDWVDLSTGINPHGYPVPPVPAEAWLRLPEDDDGREAAAAAYYGSAELLPVAGSQPAIQALPAVLRGERVSLLAPGYAEHAHAWRARRARALAAEDIDAAVADSDIVVLVQPNNPTGVHFGRARLLDWHARLAARGGWLVVDEAFVDTTPADSLVPSAGAEGLVVLRSVGKFFGLAGARVGFVFAPANVRAALAEQLGPWTLSGPARWAARHALADRARQLVIPIKQLLVPHEPFAVVSAQQPVVPYPFPGVSLQPLPKTDILDQPFQSQPKLLLCLIQQASLAVPHSLGIHGRAGENRRTRCGALQELQIRLHLVKPSRQQRQQRDIASLQQFLIFWIRAKRIKNFLKNLKN